MDKITDVTYIKPNVTKQWLLSNNFHYSTRLSDEESDVYTYRFPVYKYEKFTTLECELSIVLGDDKVKINVYDYNTSAVYAPFYYYEYGIYDKMLKTIWNNIDKQLKRLGIIKNNDKKDRNNSDRSKNKETKAKRNNSNKLFRNN